MDEGRPVGPAARPAATAGALADTRSPRSRRPTRSLPGVSRRADRVAVARLVVLGAAVAALGTYTAVAGFGALGDTLDRLGDAGMVGLAGFVVMYALATALMVPGSVSTVTAGLAFGALTGGAVSVVGATLGALTAYAIARSVGRGPMDRLLSGRARRLDNWVGKRPFRSMLALRLVPLVPFNALNYAAGLSAIRPGPYAAATAVGIAPATFAFAAVGHTARHPTSPAFVASAGLLIALLAGSSLAARLRTRRSGR